jgi:hypothetical protein
MTEMQIVGLVEILIQHEFDFKEQYMIFATIKATMSQKKYCVFRDDDVQGYVWLPPLGLALAIEGVITPQSPQIMPLVTINKQFSQIITSSLTLLRQEICLLLSFMNLSWDLP